jgi:hypothetical protein
MMGEMHDKSIAITKARNQFIECDHLRKLGFRRQRRWQRDAGFMQFGGRKDKANSGEGSVTARQPHACWEERREH